MRKSLQRRLERLERQLKPDPDEGRYCRCRDVLSILRKTKNTIVFDGNDEEAILYRRGTKGPIETRVKPGDELWCIECRLPIRRHLVITLVSPSA
ncbi:MAG: hypothetical protein OXC09_07640 [Truepera sp.]|nr:hypothetical protein [Truepera sp.]